MGPVPTSVSRPRRTSAASTAAKINASLKEESSAVPKPPSKEAKPKVKAEGKVKAASKRPAEVFDLSADDAPAPARAPKQATKQATSASAAAAPDPNAEQLLGYFISQCVGIQHYRGNGHRYNKEPLHLKRDPHNPYDKNAISVRTLAGQPVGHMQRLDALAVARVADDASMRIKMVAQVERGAGQVFKFPLRVSFFGPATARARVAGHLAHTAMSANMFGRPEIGGGIVLKEAKRGRAGGGSGGRGRGRGAATSGGAARGPGTALEHEAAGSSGGGHDDGDIEVMGERSWEEKDQELRKHAIELD